MRSVTTAHPILIRDTLMLLLLVAVMPFPASLLGRYGGEPISLAVYGGVNALATATIILMRWDVERYTCRPVRHRRKTSGTTAGRAGCT
jgi:uncharacterized membrane protein